MKLSLFYFAACIGVFLDNSLLVASYHFPNSRINNHRRATVSNSSPTTTSTALDANCNQSQDETHRTNRRSAIQKIVGTAATSLYLPNAPALAASLEQPELCLADLPPPSKATTVRLYLCRHGQTENNRLHKVQGRRVDPPLNSNGRMMAERMGQALSSQPPLSHMYHSPLLRAKETAQIAATAAQQVPLQVLDDLMEVDFGPIAEGQPTQSPSSIRVYSQWALGNLDARPEGNDGESGREVLQRCASALTSIVDGTTGEETQHVAAVAHSAYIRILLGLVLEESLAQAAARRIANGSITVLDLDGSALKVPSLLRSKGIAVTRIPQTTVMRINEERHLVGVPTT